MQPSSSMFPSKTDHIMSRYRPIAPKPVPKGEGTDQTDSHSLSSLSTDKGSSAGKSGSGGKRRSSGGGGKRGAPESSAATRSPQQHQVKRARSPLPQPQQVKRARNAVEFQPTSFNLTPIFSDRVAPVFGPGGLQRFKDSFDHSGGSSGVSVSLSLSAKSPPREEPYHPHTAAAMSAGLRCSKDGLSFNIGSSEFMKNATTTTTTPASTESEVCSAEDAPDSTRKANIVTLSLLPDTPLLASTRCSSSSNSTLSLLRSDIRWSFDPKPQATTSSDLNTSLTMSSSKGRWCDPDAAAADALRHDTGARVLDAHHLEQRHGASSEAVMLTDEMDAVLWVNSAFKRLSTERMMTRMQAIGPHIDPLGIRTHLATLTFQPQFPAPKCKATLWGFLKKFVLPEAAGAQHEGTPPQPPAPPAVIRPQGSTITVQTIVTMDAHTAPLMEPFESVQARLDEAEMPSVVTDVKQLRVRWANAAYKRLVGGQHDVTLVVSDAAQPLLASADFVAAAFSCCVRIQWSHEGEHSAMSVPSEVVRLDDAAAGALYVWGFDVCDAGVRNVLQIDDAATISPFC